VGWLLLGAVGSRKDEIGTMTVRVAGPANQGVPRVPTLALMRWALPVLQGEFPDTPAYLLVVLADDPMWRGGLSAPNSLYQHARRPLISENGTSTLIHELVHVLAPLPTAVDHDWIDEGVAEYVGLVTLLRSDTISQERFAHAIDTFRRRGASVRTLRTGNAKGAITARAVAILHDVDEELQARSGKQTDIFDLVRALTEETGPIDLARLREIAAQLGGGKPLRALAHVPDARG
jgi:hypothetical protein